MRIQARGGTIYVDDAGSGYCPPLFLHALAGSSRQWAPQLAHVRKRSCAVALDLRGHGLSDAPHDGDYSLEASADDVLAVMDGLGLDQVVLVGHSMGAAIATVFAGNYPHRVTGLLLIDPVGDQRLAPADQTTGFLATLESPAYRDLIRDYYTSIAGNDELVRATVLEDLDRTPRPAVVGMLRALNGTNLSAALSSYSGPRHAIVTALNDYPFSLHHLDPSLTHTRVDGTGHWLQMERPNELNRLLDDFVARMSPGLLA